jgi:hypothetical protein
VPVFMQYRKRTGLSVMTLVMYISGRPIGLNNNSNFFYFLINFFGLHVGNKGVRRGRKGWEGGGGVTTE